MSKTGFNLEKMERFTKVDLYINKVVNDLISKGHSKEDALKIAYNSNVVGDSIMQEAYEGS